MASDSTTPLDFLEAAIKTFKERQLLYGKEGFKTQGVVLNALFPDGITIKGEEDFNRFSLFLMLIVKICRYSKNIHKGGHDDSVHDLGVYSFMLQSFDKNNINDINILDIFAEEN